MPTTISSLQSHRHPLEIVRVVLYSLTLMGTKAKFRYALGSQLEMSGIRWRSNRIRPVQEFIHWSWRLLSLGQLDEDASTGLCIMNGPVGIAQIHPHRPTDRLQTVGAQLRQQALAQWQSIHIR